MIVSTYLSKSKAWEVFVDFNSQLPTGCEAQMSGLCIVANHEQLVGSLVQIWLHRMLNCQSGAAYDDIAPGTDYGGRLLI